VEFGGRNSGPGIRMLSAGTSENWPIMCGGREGQRDAKRGRGGPGLAGGVGLPVWWRMTRVLRRRYAMKKLEGDWRDEAPEVG
jgi:hypothetical protein